MKLVNFQAVSGSPDTQAWHDWRALGIGSSEASIIAYDAGLISEKASWMISKNRLWGIKCGFLKPVDADNPATRRGRTHEERALARIENQSGIALAPSFGEMEDFPVIRSSFDGMSFDQQVIAEVKCPSLSIHQATKTADIIPPYYLTQIAHQSLTAWGHPDNWQNEVILYGSFVPETNDLHIVDITAHQLRDRLNVIELYEGEKAFWTWVQAQSQEAQNHSPEWIAAAIEWLDLSEKAAETEKRIDDLRKTLIAPLSNDRPILKGFGVEVSQGLPSTTTEVDYKALFEAVVNAAKIQLNQPAWERKFTTQRTKKGRVTVRRIR